MPLSIAGSALGILAILPKDNEKLNDEKMELLTIILNILAMSLKNAQEYHELKEMSVNDGLIGILNEKGFNLKCRHKALQRETFARSKVLHDIKEVSISSSRMNF